MSGAFERKYTEDQKEAAIYAYFDRRIRPLRALIGLASRGELITRDGRQVRPFELNENSAKGWIYGENRKRKGKLPGAAFDRPDDTVEALRRRLIAVSDSELSYVERQRTGKRDPEHLRQIARLVREVAALPKPGEGRSRTPGQKENGHKDSGETTGGIAGSLLKAHRQTPAPEHPSMQKTTAENTSNSATTRSEDQQDNDGPNPNHDEPGSSQRSADQRINAGAQTHTRAH